MVCSLTAAQICLWMPLICAMTAPVSASPRATNGHAENRGRDEPPEADHVSAPARVRFGGLIGWNSCLTGGRIGYLTTEKSTMFPRPRFSTSRKPNRVMQACARGDLTGVAGVGLIPTVHGQGRRARFGLVVAALLVVGTTLCPSRARAYPWMIRHDHNGCVQCHMDPSGSGLLTAYGRESGDDELTMRYRPAPAGDEARKSGPLWGRLDAPDWLLVGAGFRLAFLDTKVSGAPAGPTGSPSAAWSGRPILMQADLRAGVRVGGFRASGTIGVVTDKSYASVAGNLVSREHWVGYSFDSDTFILRAGRMNLPFGIRSIEHTLWVRQSTQTDINDMQEHGVALAYNTQKIRGEIMGILGNYQISPDAYRQRGYSATLEAVPVSGLAIGASSLLTHVSEDFRLRVENLHQAHGLFVRASPVAPLVILAEGDLVIDSPKGSTTAKGFATMLQGDVEPLQGLHLILTGETWAPGGSETLTSYGGWAAVDWFCLRQLDVRADFMWRSMAFGAERLDAMAFLVQLHLYL